MLNIPATGNTVTDDGASTSTVTVAYSNTASIAAGNYTWVATVEKDGERYEAGRGTFTVLANASAAAAGDLQSFAEEMLANVEDEIRARITGDGSAHNSYTIGTAAGGRSLDKMTLAELTTLRDKLRNDVQRERFAGKLAPVTITFRSPC